MTPRRQKTCRLGSRHTTRYLWIGCQPDRSHTALRRCGRRRPIRQHTQRSLQHLLIQVTHTYLPDTRPRTGLESTHTCLRDSRRTVLLSCCRRRTDPFHTQHMTYRLRVHTYRLGRLRRSSRQWLSKCLPGRLHTRLRSGDRGPSYPQDNQSTMRSRQARSSRRRTLHTLLHRCGGRSLRDTACTSHSHPQSCQLSTAVRSTRTVDRHQLALSRPAQQ